MIEREEKSAQIEVGRCPKCGVLGRNHQPPDREPDSWVTVIPLECPNCGHEWTERVSEKYK